MVKKKNKNEPGLSQTLVVLIIHESVLVHVHSTLSETDRHAFS